MMDNPVTHGIITAIIALLVIYAVVGFVVFGRRAVARMRRIEDRAAVGFYGSVGGAQAHAELPKALVRIQAVRAAIEAGRPVSADCVSDALLEAETLGMDRSAAVFAAWMRAER